VEQVLSCRALSSLIASRIPALEPAKKACS